MPIEVIFAAGAAGITALAFFARHERRLVKARRQRALDRVRDLFTNVQLTADGSGMPRLEGGYNGRHLKLVLIPDTMTIRRLPQLWLSLTALGPLAPPDGGIAILVRPSGADYYSLTERMNTHFDPPAGFPWECLVRGQSETGGTTLASIAPAAAKILADPKVKEIAVTQRGVRIVYQLAEGQRGPHLLLRQCDFEDAHLEPDLLARLTADLDTLAGALGTSLNQDPS